jgi:hypothetical protein
MRLKDLLLVPAFFLAVMILNVAISFVVVWVWGTFFEPGHPEAYYQAFAQKAAPVSSVVFGMPLMFGAGWLIACGRTRHDGLMAAGAVALLYVVVDVAILLALKVEAQHWFWPLISYPTKLIAGLAGGWLATRRG